MNTHGELERIVSDWMEDRVVDPPHGSLQSALARAARTPQQRHRWLPGSIARLANTTGGGLDTSERGTPPGGRIRTMAILSLMGAAAAALAVIVALIIPRLATEPTELPPGGVTYSVAADGDFESIAEAVAAAQDGDTVLVEPGTYEEAFLIEADITLAGTGSRPRETVIAVPPDAPGPAAAIGPLHPSVPGFEAPARPAVGVQLSDSSAVLRNLQIEGQDDGVAVLVRGGAPVFEDVIIRHPGERDTNRMLAASVVVDGAAEPTFRGAQLWHRVQIDDGSRVALVGTQLQWARAVVQGGAHLDLEGGSSFASDNQPLTVADGGTVTIVGARFMQGGVDIVGGEGAATAAEISGSQFSSAPGSAVRATDGASLSLHGNSFTDDHRAVAVVAAEAVVTGNTFLGNGTALELRDARGVYADNDIDGGVMGIDIQDGGKPAIENNTVDDARSRAIVIGAGTSPMVDGNRFCGSLVNILVEPGSEPILGDNDICPDGPTAG